MIKPCQRYPLGRSFINSSIMSEAQTQVFFYGLKLLVVIILSLIVVFRRQMSCNSVYVDDEFDKSTDNCNTKKRRELVRRGFERNCGSVDTERTRKSDKGIMNSAGDTIPLKSYSSGRRIQTVIWQAVLRLGRQNLDDYFRVKETTDEEPFAQQCSFNSSCVSDMDLSQRASPVIHGREYSASHLLGLPPDIQIHIMSYLHPRDVLAMSCSDHNTQNLVNGDKNTSQHCSSTSTILWFTLWNRDYGWVLREWNIGMEAVQRSSDSIACSSNDNTLRCPSILASILNINTHHLDKPGEKNNDAPNCLNTTGPSMKEFYLIFSLTWQNYCIAGHSTATSCLTGIHGHVFDMTKFLPKHPGSPDSLIMHGGGKDATSIFESVGHSLVARKAAWRSCALAVDRSCCTPARADQSRRKNRTGTSDDGRSTRGCGIVPCTAIGSTEEDLSTILPRHRSNKPRVPGTLQGARKRFHREREVAHIKAVRTEARELAKRDGGDIVGNINVYFDPICQRWKGWYLDMEFSPVFLHNL